MRQESFATGAIVPLGAQCDGASLSFSLTHTHNAGGSHFAPEYGTLDTFMAGKEVDGRQTPRLRTFQKKWSRKSLLEHGTGTARKPLRFWTVVTHRTKLACVEKINEL
jgi:hypothetical protein